MALQPRFLPDATPTHVALKIFGIAIVIGLLIIGLLYIIYAGSLHRSGIKYVSSRRRAQDPETGADTITNCSNPHRPHSVDTLPRYTASDEALPSDGSEQGRRTVEGEGGKPPPYTLDAGGAADAESERGDDHGDVRVGVTTSPAPVHLQVS